MAERVQFAWRTYQYNSYDALQNGKNRFVERLHRRSGKDRNWLNTIFLESQKRVGNYITVFPTQNQGRHDIWDNTFHTIIDGKEYPVKLYDETGFFISIFPPELVRAKDEAQMQLELINGSMYQVMGADDERAIARLRGQNGLGYVLSEYAFFQTGDSVWTTLEPVLLENKGWAAFISTPNIEGDHFDQLCDFAQVEQERENSKWFFQHLTIEDTSRDAPGEDGTRVVTLEDIETLRRQNRREEEIQREYYCNNKGYRRGTIYGDLVSAADAAGRIGDLGYIPQLPVGTMFDLGYSKTDAMAMWFYQRPDASRVNFIDYYEVLQKDLQHMTHVMREERKYIYGRMCLPHDGKSAREYFYSVGFTNIDVAQRPQGIKDAIDAVRRDFSMYFFDKKRCQRGLECLAKYKYEWDNDRKVFGNAPLHDQYSHGASAIASGALCGYDPLHFVRDYDKPVKVETSFDPTAIYRG